MAFVDSPSLLSRISKMIHDITQEIPAHVTIPMAVIALIIGSWHFYMFTLRPLRRPLEPVTLPYWIPCTHSSL